MPRWRASCRRSSTQGALVLGEHGRGAPPRAAHPHHSKGVAVVVHGCRQGCGQFQVISRHMAADNVPKLRRYCAENFAASVVSVDSPERTSAALAEVVWLATLDHAKAVTSHRRSARVVLAKLHIPTAGVKGWLVLEADEAVRVAAAQHRVDRPMQLTKRRAHARPPVVSPMTPCFKVPARLEKQLEQETRPRAAKKA